MIIANLAGLTGTPITASGYRAEADLDRDGDPSGGDNTDLAIADNATYTSALAKGELSQSGVDNTVDWSGYQYDGASGGGLYCVRFRYYDPTTFRWLNRDPAGYTDSMNLYGLGAGSPVGFLDPFGLAGGPFFAGGVTLDGQVITYDQIDMVGMDWFGLWFNQYTLAIRALLDAYRSWPQSSPAPTGSGVAVDGSNRHSIENTSTATIRSGTLGLHRGNGVSSSSTGPGCPD